VCKGGVFESLPVAEHQTLPVKRKTKNVSRGSAEITIASVELFSELPARTLLALENNTKATNVRPGYVFFKTGEAGQGLYVVESGHVQTYRNFGEKKLIIAELSAPAIFGEMGCVGPRLYHCVAEATEESRIRAITSAQMDALREEFPGVTRKLLDLVSERFVDALLELESSSFRHLIPRLAKLLHEKAKEDCVCNATHKEIAERLRVYRETVTSAIGELRKAGIIAVERKRIRILDHARLERASREG